MGVFLRSLVLVLGLVLSGVAAGKDEVHVHAPWVQAAPPGAKVLAAYLEIMNAGDKPQVLVSVSSPSFGEVSIHKSVMHGNMMHMEHLKELAIPSRSSVTLKPGDMHLMLMGGKKALNPGDKVQLTLVFKSGASATVTAAVRPLQGEEEGGRQHMDHSDHSGHK